MLTGSSFNVKKVRKSSTKGTLLKLEDCNSDAAIEISYIVHLSNYVLYGGSEPNCQ
jgi:hypothetical protein